MLNSDHLLPSSPLQDISAMTEEEQLALALQMSMQAGSGMMDQPMETESAAALVEVWGGLVNVVLISKAFHICKSLS